MLRRILIVITFGLLSSVAFAGTATLSWIPPTQNTDGSTYTNYGGFKIYYGISGQPLNTIIDIPDTTNTISRYAIENLAAGDWQFAMTAYNSSGLESDRSVTVGKTIVDTQPGPPQLIFVTVSTVVYNVVKRTDGFILVPVGTVPLDTPCDPVQDILGHFVVPVSSVTWSGTVKPVVVVGTCSER